MDPVLKQFLDDLKERREKGVNGHFGQGVATVADYAKHFLAVAGESAKAGVDESWLKSAEEQLTFSSNDLLIAEKEIATSTGEMKKLVPKGTELPKHCAMVFRNVLTATHEDRDADVLHAEGADIDPKMPLLWQHMPMMPIGKYLGTHSRNKRLVKVVNALLDINQLTGDCLKLIEAGALRISHGFIPTEMKRREDNGKYPWKGFDITKFEVMENSVVSVPSNVSAVIEAYSRDVLKSAPIREWGKQLADARTKVFGTAGQGDHEKSAVWLNVNDDGDLEPTAFDQKGGEPLVVFNEKGLDAFLSRFKGESGSDESKGGPAFQFVMLDENEKRTVDLAGDEALVECLSKHVPAVAEALSLKAGAKLSKATRDLLGNCKADIAEACKDENISRANKALLERCVARLDELLKMPEEDDDDDDDGDDEKSIDLELKLVSVEQKDDGSASLKLSVNDDTETNVELPASDAAKLANSGQLSFKTRTEVISYLLANGDESELKGLHDSLGILLGIAELDAIGR